MSRRLEKVSSLLKKEVAEALLKEADLGDSIATVTAVKVSPNLRICWISISVMPEEKEKEVMRSLKKSVYDIQVAVNKKLKMRVPKICFEIDEGIKNLYKIDEISSGREE